MLIKVKYLYTDGDFVIVKYGLKKYRIDLKYINEPLVKDQYISVEHSLLRAA